MRCSQRGRPVAMRMRRRIRRQRRYPARSVSAGRSWFASPQGLFSPCSGSSTRRESPLLALLWGPSSELVSYELPKYPACLHQRSTRRPARGGRRDGQLSETEDAANADGRCLALCRLRDVGGCRAAVQCEELRFGRRLARRIRGFWRFWRSRAWREK